MIYILLIPLWIGVQGMGCGENKIMSYWYQKLHVISLGFIDHLMVMFGETPSWDLEQKYCPDNLE